MARGRTGAPGGAQRPGRTALPAHRPAGDGARQPEHQAASALAPEVVAQDQPAHAQGEPAAHAQGEVRLALATRRTALAPDTLGLGETNLAYDLGGGLTARGWSRDQRQFSVDADGRLLGWVESIGRVPGWTALADGRLILDAADLRPIQCQGPAEAAELLRLALRQQLIRPAP
jgi:hypothetical protein